jgi:hypothetical protein
MCLLSAGNMVNPWQGYQLHVIMCLVVSNHGLTCWQTTTLELHPGCVDVSYFSLFLISVILDRNEI